MHQRTARRPPTEASCPAAGDASSAKASAPVMIFASFATSISDPLIGSVEIAAPSALAQVAADPIWSAPRAAVGTRERVGATCEAAGGNLVIYSSPGLGAAVEIWLPAR